MHDDEEKAKIEILTFEEFVGRSDLPIDRQSIRKCEPPEPDILCKVSGEYVAFELVEVCSPEIPQMVSFMLQKKGESSQGVWTDDPAYEIAVKKIKKSLKYQTDYPIEILFYTDGNVVQPPDMSIRFIQDAFSSHAGRFRKAWFMGQTNETCECIVDLKET